MTVKEPTLRETREQIDALTKAINQEVQELEALIAGLRTAALARDRIYRRWYRRVTQANTDAHDGILERLTAIERAMTFYGPPRP